MIASGPTATEYALQDRRARRLGELCGRHDHANLTGTATNFSGSPRRRPSRARRARTVVSLVARVHGRERSRSRAARNHAAPMRTRPARSCAGTPPENFSGARSTGLCSPARRPRSSPRRRPWTCPPRPAPSVGQILKANRRHSRGPGRRSPPGAGHERRDGAGLTGGPITGQRDDLDPVLGRHGHDARDELHQGRRLARR